MSYFRSSFIFLMGYLLGSVVMSAVARGYPTILEVSGAVIYVVGAALFASLNKRLGNA